MTSPTSDIVARLRERYTAEEMPPCPVCGEPLSIQSAGGGNATVYGCERHRPFDMKHYERSRWTQYRPGDRDVLEAVDALVTAERLLAEAREALRPFAEYMQNGGDLDNKGNPLPDEQGVGWVYLTMADFRKARAALGEQP